MKPLICIDVGAGTLKLAEFAVQTDGTLQLCRYAIEPLPKTEDGPESKAAVSAAIGKVLAEHKIRGRGVEVNLCLPSHQVFTKPLRTPPVEGTKVGQIIRYEAQENVPFPLDEVRWDYQILGTAESGELDVLLMALKTEVVEAATDVCRQHKLRLQIIDGSITALRNAFMHNYGEMEECSLLLSIGARSTNVLFIRGTTFYARTINIGAHSITEGFAQEAGISLEQAEQFKVENGYVHLGGSFEESQDPYQAIVSKVARNVMTRLHQQVAQTIQFYRAQQAGPAPKRVYLAGGGGALSYTADFIQDKLQLPVEFFNPFRNVKVDDKLDGEKLAAVAHSMGELVGLGLRNVTVGMTEFNLLPQREQISRQIDRRSPYAIAAIFCVGLIFTVLGVHDMRLAEKRVDVADAMEKAAPEIPALIEKIETAVKEADKGRVRAEAMMGAFDSRHIWINLLAALRESMLQIEPHVKITGFLAAPNAPRSILRMDQYPAGLVAAQVRPWKELSIETNSFHRSQHGFTNGTPVKFFGVPPNAAAALGGTNVFFTGGRETNIFSIHRNEQDAASGADPVIFKEEDVQVQITPGTSRLIFPGHKFRKGNAVRFSTGPRPGVARQVSTEAEYFVSKVSDDVFTLHTAATPNATNQIFFASPGRAGQYSISTNAAAANGPAGADANATRGVPLIDIITHQVQWAKHGFAPGQAVKFSGSPAALPEESQPVPADRSYYVKVIDANTFTLHTAHVVVERNQVMFTLPDPAARFTLSGVPGYFAVDSPRPKEPPQFEGVLNTITAMGGTYALEAVTGKVIYVGLVGKDVKKDAITEQVLQELAPLRDLKNLDVWLNPYIEEVNQPAYFAQLDGFRKTNVPTCSVNLAVPTTLWVRSLSPPELKQPAAAAKAGAAPAGQPPITELALKVRARSLEGYYTDANLHYANMVVEAIAKNPYFAAAGGQPQPAGAPRADTGTRMSGNLQKVGDKPFLFEFDVTLLLGKPIPLQEGATGIAAAAGGAGAPAAPAGGTGVAPPGKSF
ncbi:MAG: type IV pilus assembly protein PilM [Pedosphaera sp.]|nr:type IV pilus assembly protein PilM [Pedosphaera sp.]